MLPSPTRLLQTQRFVEATSRLTEATGLVMQTVSAQHAAYCELLIGACGRGSSHRRRTAGLGMHSSVPRFIVAALRFESLRSDVASASRSLHVPFDPCPAAVFYALTFPVQRPQLFVLSWPYFPQLQVCLGCRPGCPAGGVVGWLVGPVADLSPLCLSPDLFRSCHPFCLQLLGRAAALELGMDISDYPTYSSDRGDS